MKIRIIALLLSLTPITNNLYAQSIPSLPPHPPADLKIVSALPTSLPLSLPPTLPSSPDAQGLQFTDITISNLLKVIFSEVLQSNYVLSTKVIEDNRPISFRFNKTKDGKLESFLGTFLKSLGYNMTMKNGVYYIEEPPQKSAVDYDYFVYIPKYKTADYLADAVRPYFGDAFSASNREVNTPTRTTVSTEGLSPTNALMAGNKSYDILTFKYDDLKLKKKILSFLSQIDKPEPNILVKTYTYEVSYTEQDGSALGLMMNLASSKLNISLGATNPLDNAIKFSSNALSLFVSNLSTDGRVKLISNQQVRLKNREEAVFKSGQKIPTLGSVSYQGTSGTPVQNIEKVDTGSIIRATPNIKANAIDMDFYQEISEAVNTTTGVNNSPTIQQRSLQNKFTTHLNEVVMLAGLTQLKQTNNVNQPFFLPWFKSSTKQNTKTDIVIFVEVLPVNAEVIPEKAILEHGEDTNL